jgi:hypothetical protein
MVEPKKVPKLDTDFTCPFCNHPGAVQCNIFLRALGTPSVLRGVVQCLQGDLLHLGQCTDGAHRGLQRVDRLLRGSQRGRRRPPAAPGRRHRLRSRPVICVAEFGTLHF